MTTIHVVYPHGSRISCPDAIGRNLGRRLEDRGYSVLYHNWDDVGVIKPGPNDVLLGHVHPSPGTVFRRSMTEPGWRRVIVLEPYTHGDDFRVAFLDSVLEHCDLFLTITGNYWFASIEQSLFAHWRPKMIHLDLAVERKDFPVLKTRFNPVGKRRFVYIGHVSSYKNTRHLSAIAARLPDAQVSHIGTGMIRGLTPLGYQNFA